MPAGFGLWLPAGVVHGERLTAGADDTTKTSTGPVSMTDGVGREVELAKPAQRVAVLERQQTEDVLTDIEGLTAVGSASVFCSDDTP